MRELSSAEIYVIVEELQRIKGFYIKKFYDLGDDAFRISLSSKEGKESLYIKLLKTINITNFAEDTEMASNFAMAIRRRIGTSKIIDIKQHATDRIIVITLSGIDNYNIIIEMFGKGNLILTDSNDIISLIYRTIDQRERKLKPKKKYSFPSQGLTFDSMTRDIIKERVNEAVSEKHGKLIKSLLHTLDFGPIYLEDIMTRAGLDPNTTAEINNQEMGNLVDQAFIFLESLKSPKAILYVDEKGNAVDYSVRDLIKYNSVKKIAYESFGEALDEFYKKNREETTHVDNREYLETCSSIKKQEELMLKFEEDEKSSRTAGSKIFNRMHDINQLIAYLKENKRVTLEEARNVFPALKIKDLDLQKKTVILDLD
jgi:predicted ribosome quality control (RQC) complex YloA/Tae2 family protein